ncbi:MAG: hypothetical protein MJY50_06410 [Bacteroidales bacterium]|nr:hypothetical protein [Bacteroidales bacterium]
MKLPIVDIHNHLLPGVDDGFREVSHSIQAIRAMAENGCRELIFTPHMNPDVYSDESESHFREVYKGFSAMIPESFGIKTSLAAEYMVVQGFEDRAEHPEELLTMPDGSILVEMSYYFRSENMEQALFNLNIAGLKPIIAHPERYLYMSSCLGDFDKFKDIGCRFQMNLASLTGKYGPHSIKILCHLLDEGMYDFVATDLHSNPQLYNILESEPVPKVRRSFEKFLARTGVCGLVDEPASESFLSRLFHRS